MSHFVVAAGGQSNLRGVTGPCPFGVVPPGCSWVHNGAELAAGAAYPSLVGPVPWFLDEIVLLGHTASVIDRSVNGMNLAAWLDTQWPLLRAECPVADAFVWLQGEADALNESLASQYEARLLGPQLLSLADVVQYWGSSCRWLVTELGVREAYGPFAAVVRAAHHRAGAQWPTGYRSRLIPTYDCTRLSNATHYTPDENGLGRIGRRWAREIVTPGSV